MWHLFCPDFRSEKITDIDIQWLHQHQVSTIILDVDNTLLPWDKMQPEEKNIAWIKNMEKEGIKFILLSNNGGKRLDGISEELNLPAVRWAAKPLPLGFKRALHRLRTSGKDEVLVIGDQIITDVLGAKQLGLKVLWVESLAKKEFLVTRLTRKVERVVINKLVQKGLMPERGSK